MSDSDRLFTSTPREFFRSRIRQACDEQRVEPSETAEFYLVLLLERFVHHERGLLDRPLALDYLASFEEQPMARYGKLRHVGDTALFVAGVFTESLGRSPVGSDYYTSLGGLAYGHLASMPGTPHGRSAIELFTELSMRFLDFVRVLSHMSLDDIFASDRDTLRVYRRWLVSRGARDAELLVRRGIIPFAPKKNVVQ
jgi:hypothetical protein